MSNVVNLTGAALPEHVDDNIVEVLERYLEQAKRGEIAGLAVAVARPNDLIGTAFWHGSSGHRLTAAVTSLFYRVCRFQYEGSE